MCTDRNSVAEIKISDALRTKKSASICDLVCLTYQNSTFLQDRFHTDTKIITLFNIIYIMRNLKYLYSCVIKLASANQLIYKDTSFELINQYACTNEKTQQSGLAFLPVNIATTEHHQSLLTRLTVSY